MVCSCCRQISQLLFEYGDDLLCPRCYQEAKDGPPGEGAPQ